MVDVVFGNGGHTLEPTLRAPIEAHLRADLSAVRIHNGAHPAASARDLRARAYTIGNQVVFGSGQYSPGTRQGQRLLVHELAHVAQQQATGGACRLQKQEEGAAQGTESASPPGSDTQQAPAGWKATVVNAIVGALDLPGGPTMLLLARFGEGIGESLAKEGPAAIARLATRAAAMTPGDYAELAKGYVLGLIDGIVSPVTDLFGLGVFGEQVLNAMAGFAESVLNRGGQLGAELKAVTDAAGKLIHGAGEVWKHIHDTDGKQLVKQIMGFASSLPAKAQEEARQLGQSAGSAIIAGLESPWEKEKPESEASSGGWHPLEKIQSAVTSGWKRLVGDVPWAKLGHEVGHALAFAAIQVILLVFTEGIGNAIEQAAAGLGRLAGTLGKFGKAVGKVADLLGEIGRAISWVEGLTQKLLGAALKPLEKLLEPILEPFNELLVGLRTMLKKLLGIAEKDGPALEEAALGAAEKHAPAPPPPAGHPPAAHPAAGHPSDPHAAPGHPPAKPTPPVGEHAPPKKPTAPHGEPLVKEPVAGGHTVEVTEHGIEVCSAKPCPVLHVEYAKELKADAELQKELDEINILRKTKPNDAAKRAAKLREELEARRHHPGVPSPPKMGSRKETLEEFKARGGKVQEVKPGPVPKTTEAEKVAVGHPAPPAGYEDMPDYRPQTRKQAGVSLAEDHHIASKYRKENKAIFERLGMSIDDDLNLIVDFEEHGQLRGWYDWDERGYKKFYMKGHHPEYNAWVTKQLQEASPKGLAPDEALKRVQNVLQQLKKTVRENPELLSHGPRILRPHVGPSPVHGPTKGQK